MFQKTAAMKFVLAALCLLLVLPSAMAETRQSVIVLEGMEEPIQETLFESPQGFSFWYANEKLEAYEGNIGVTEGVIVQAMYADDYMLLSMITQEDAEEYAEDLHVNIVEKSAQSRVQMDVYRELEDGQYFFLTLVAENGQYLSAVGQYSQEAAEGTAKYLDRVLDSVAFPSAYDAEMLKLLPGEWAEESEGAGAALTLEENGDMSLSCYVGDEGDAYSYDGTWSYRSVPEYGGQLTLLFTSTDNPLKDDESEYRVECVYAAYTESWVENDTEYTYLILNPPISCSGVSPFEEVFGEDGVALHREKGPNMRVVKCKEYVSLRESRSVSSKRLAKVPLGAVVLAYPEYEENGFIPCVYHDEYGFILSEYLRPVQ